MKDCRNIEWLIADHGKTKIQTIIVIENIIEILVTIPYYKMLPC